MIAFTAFNANKKVLWSASPMKNEVPLLRAAFRAKVEPKCWKNLEWSVNHGQRNDA
ncbi:MAG: hypothetical protein WCC45_09425 [Paeniglutamicibacter sp.]|jgi:hypothetical protein|uniref:hypothetical protein n=1 Tax=Arthrobacter sp. UCD-GKA TaxID=1913576 RepID=UPI001587DCCE|nr:hypothetical protein [Arthrobacter sp. UCD-GKA]